MWWQSQGRREPAAPTHHLLLDTTPVSYLSPSAHIRGRGVCMRAFVWSLCTHRHHNGKTHMRKCDISQTRDINTWQYTWLRPDDVKDGRRNPTCSSGQRCPKPWGVELWNRSSQPAQGVEGENWFSFSESSMLKDDSLRLTALKWYVCVGEGVVTGQSGWIQIIPPKVNLGHCQFIFAMSSPENSFLGLNLSAEMHYGVLHHAQRRFEKPKSGQNRCKVPGRVTESPRPGAPSAAVRSSSPGLNYEEFILCILLVFSIGSV